MPDVVATFEAAYLLTCLPGEMRVQTPTGIKPENHARLSIHDIAEPIDGHVAPDAAHVAQLLAFATAWDRRGAMVIHCWAGISRSTAAAFVSRAGAGRLGAATTAAAFRPRD